MARHGYCFSKLTNSLCPSQRQCLAIDSCNKKKKICCRYCEREASELQEVNEIMHCISQQVVTQWLYFGSWRVQRFLRCSTSTSIFFFFLSSSQPEFLSCTLLLATQSASAEETALLTVTTAFCITKEEEIGKQEKEVEMGTCQVCKGSSSFVNMCVCACVCMLTCMCISNEARS